MQKMLLSLLLILAIFAVPMVAQDEPKKEDPAKEEPKTDPKTDGIEPVEPVDPKAAEEAEAWTKIQEVMDKLKDRSMPRDKFMEVYKEVAGLCYGYLEKYWEVEKTHTSMAASYAINYLLYDNQKEKFLKLSEKCMKSDAIDDRFKNSIRTKRASIFMEDGKYKEALAEFEDLKIDITKLDWDGFYKNKDAVITMSHIYFKMKKMDKYNAILKKVEELFDNMEEGNKFKPYKKSYVGKIEEITVSDGCDAPNWKVIDFEGKEVELKSFKGKYVLLDFWATWCGPCRAAMESHLKPMFARYKSIADKFVIISIGSASSRETIEVEKAFIEKMGYKWTFLYDKEKTAATQYFVSGIPTLVFIDPEGKIIYRGHGNVADKVQEYLDKKFDIKEQPEEEKPAEEAPEKDKGKTEDF